MAAPWWVQEYSFYQPDPESGGSGYVQTGYKDVRTGQPVYPQGGQYYDASGTPVSDTPVKTVQFMSGYQAPYGNLGGEVGMVDGKPTYLYPLARGATTAGDIGTYGGAQRAFWRSPSGAQGTVVRGPDGTFWVAPPPDAQFGEADTADHSTVLGQLASTYGPFIAAAMGAPGVDIATGAAVPSLSSQLANYLGLGSIAGSAAMGGLSSLVQGGDPLKGALGGAVGAGVNELAGPLLKDAGVSPALSKSIIGAGTSALTGGNPLLGALTPAIKGLTGTEGEITGPMADTQTSGTEVTGFPDPSAGVELPKEPVETPPIDTVSSDTSFIPDQTQATETPSTDELGELNYTPPEEGLSVPGNLLAQIFNLGQQKAPSVSTATDPTTGRSSALLSGLGVATSPDKAIGAGELESTRTGKKRRNVWNVASLKNLQDALGV